MLILVEYVDGTEENIETKDGTSVMYDKDMRCFKFETYEGKVILIHRDFVKSIRMV